MNEGERKKIMTSCIKPDQEGVGKTCEMCGNAIEKDAFRIGDGRYAHKECVEKQYFFCVMCKKWHSRASTTIKTGARIESKDFFITTGDMCGPCYNKAQKCRDCGAIIGWVENAEPLGGYCARCYLRNGVDCEICGAFVFESKTIDGSHYCNPCFNNEFAICARCGNYKRRSDMITVEGRLWCKPCGLKQYIKSYSDKPSPKFFAMTNERPAYHIGAEIEMIPPNKWNRYECAKWLHDKSKGAIYGKEDSSITQEDPNAFEAVSHPFTARFHNNEMHSILDTLVERGCKSYSTDKCGQHFHVSRKAAGPYTWYKVASCVFGIFPDKALYKVSQRQREDELEHYAKLRSDETTGTNISKWVRGESRNGDRYLAMNWQNKDTVEFRMFKGNLDYRRYMKNIEFITSLIDYCRRTTELDLSWKGYVDYFMNSQTYKFLQAFYIDRFVKKEVQCAS